MKRKLKPKAIRLFPEDLSVRTLERLEADLAPLRVLAAYKEAFGEVQRALREKRKQESDPGLYGGSPVGFMD